MRLLIDRTCLINYTKIDIQNDQLFIGGSDDYIDLEIESNKHVIDGWDNNVMLILKNRYHSKFFHYGEEIGVVKRVTGGWGWFKGGRSASLCPLQSERYLAEQTVLATYQLIKSN